MKYFVTGITGTVVPVIIENLMASDPDPHFYFALRKGSGGKGLAARLAEVVDSMDLDRKGREKLIQRSRLVEKGYYEKVLADTLETGWGGLVDFKRLKKKTAGLKPPREAFSHSRR